MLVPFVLLHPLTMLQELQLASESIKNYSHLPHTKSRYYLSSQWSIPTKVTLATRQSLDPAPGTPQSPGPVVGTQQNQGLPWTLK